MYIHAGARVHTISTVTQLPTRLLDLVLETLVSPSDYLHFGCVCKSWKHAAEANKKQRALVSTFCPPLLLISTGKNGTWRLWDAMNNKVFDLQLKLSNKWFCGSSKGWLIAVDQSQTITLICNYGVYKATISADPILFAEDCIVLVIYEDLLQLAFIKLRDTRWTYVDRRWKMLEDVVCFQDNFYLDNRRTLLSFHLTRRSYTKVSLIARAKKPEDPCFKTYLVNSNEEKLLMMTEFKIFELDYAKCKWIAMDTLLDAALFLGDNSSVCVLASKFPGCQANCIYYNHDADGMSFDVGPYGPHDFGVYNVITRQEISKPYTKDVMAFVKSPFIKMTCAKLNNNNHVANSIQHTYR
ncbi:unnamed protein product [Malus baccata var. baccata]